MTAYRPKLQNTPDGRTRARLEAPGQPYINVGYYSTREEAQEACRAELELRAQPKPPHTEARIEGQTVAPAAGPDSDVWDVAIQLQERRAARRQSAPQNVVELPAEPVALAILSDLHMGNPGTDYRTMRADAVLVRETAGMYALFNGDATDNWVVEKLRKLQAGQLLNADDEWEIFVSWLEILRSKLAIVVSGNHDLWSGVANVDRIAGLLSGTRALYGRHQVVFDLKHGNVIRRVKARHKWRGNSLYNSTHGLEVGWDRGDDDYDWAIGGHTHIATICRPFYRHGRPRHAILVGTYKLEDEHAEAIGFARSQNRGCGAMALHPDGRQWWFNELREAAEFLEWLREKWFAGKRY